MIWAICVLVDVSKYLDILTLGSLIKIKHLPFRPGCTASAACPAHPGNLEKTSITFAAVICEADDPCSRRKMNSVALVPCFSDQLIFVSDFRQLPCWYFLQFAHSFCTAAFASGIHIALGIGVKLCTRLQWLSEFMPLPAMWSSWFLFWDPSMRILIDSSASTIQAHFVLCCPTVQEVSLCLWCWKSTGIAAGIEAWFLDCPFFASLCVSMHQKYVSTFLAIICRALRSFVFLSVSSQTMYTSPVASHSTQWILWNQSTYLTIHDLHQHPSNRRYFSNITSKIVSVVPTSTSCSWLWGWYCFRCRFLCTLITVVPETTLVSLRSLPVLFPRVTNTFSSFNTTKSLVTLDHCTCFDFSCLASKFRNRSFWIYTSLDHRFQSLIIGPRYFLIDFHVVQF